MKVLAYSHRLGYQTINFIHNELQYLDHEIELEVLTHHFSNNNPVVLKNINVIRHYEHSFIGKFLSLFNYRSFRKDFYLHVTRFNPDIIHIQFGNIAVRVLEHLKELNIPVFITFHGHDASSMLKDSNYKKKLNQLFERPNIHAIFVSKYLLNNLLKVNVRPKNIELLYCGIDLGTFERTKYNNQNRTFVFLQVSSFNEKKGHIYTLQAYKIFKQKHPNVNTELVFGGGGIELEDVKKIALMLGLKENVKFYGWASVKEVKELMENADVFLHHSITSTSGDTEGIPTVIMEAMAMKLPIISTYHSGIPELVEDSINGYLVEEKNIEHYAQRMYDILDWGYLDINRTKVKNLFESKVHGEKLLEIYKKHLI